MDSTIQPRILIAGAGAMGIITGYHLALSGAAVTYLVRPHRLQALAEPQILYNYDDTTLKSYHGYALVSDLGDLEVGAYDYVVITLDSAALRDPDGERLVQAIGRIARQGSTRVILGAIGVELRPWFLAMSGLADHQVTNGSLAIQCHSVAGADFPLHAPTNRELLAQADLAYRHCWSFGFMVDDSAPEVANDFATIYSASGVSQCVVQPAEQLAAYVAPIFAQQAAWDIAGWPNPSDTDPGADFWQLATAATHEIQGLRIFGASGQKMLIETTPGSLMEFWRTWEQDMLPLDVQAFNRYHHGGKVNRQDLQILNDLITHGEADGQSMAATRELLERQTALKR